MIGDLILIAIPSIPRCQKGGMQPFCNLSFRLNTIAMGAAIDNDPENIMWGILELFFVSGTAIRQFQTIRHFNHSCHSFNHPLNQRLCRWVEISGKTDRLATGAVFVSKGHLLWYGVWIQVAHARLAWLFLGPGLQVPCRCGDDFETHH